MKRFAILSLVLFTLSGCGLKSIVIPNLDWIITRELNQSLDLDGPRKRALQIDIASLLQDSKPQAIIIKQELTKIELNSIDIFALSQELNQRYQDFVYKFIPLYAKYLSDLSSEQIENFKLKNQEDNENILEEHADVEKTSIKRFRRFLGELTHDQKKLINLNVEIYKKHYKNRLIRRKKYQEVLYQILEDKPRTRRQKIIELTLNYNKPSKINPNRNKSLHLVAEVLKIATDKQSKHFREQINEYIPWIDRFIEEDFI